MVPLFFLALVGTMIRCAEKPFHRGNETGTEQLGMIINALRRSACLGR